MANQAKLKYSLAGLLLILVVINVVFVYLAAHAASHQQPFAMVPETMPIGIKWLVLLGVAVVSVGIAFWVHRAFLEGGVPPVDTTWVDLVIMAYALLTFISILFLGEGYWLFFLIFIFLLFFFAAFVLWRLLNNHRHWWAWLLSTFVLTGLTVLFISTLSS
jgi:hypothetical protein